MNILTLLQDRVRAALAQVGTDLDELADLVRPGQDPKFGDYQANCAMPLAKRLGKPSREVAGQIVAHLQVDDLCEPPDIAGPGFINLRLRTAWITEKLQAMLADPRLGVPAVERPRTFVVDYSAPNVAKPMHVGHIRSTVIGDSLTRVLRFLGHNVISDNHLGDWGTQFGMIIYGYRHFLDAAAYEREAVTELARLYRLVRQLVDYHAGRKELPTLLAQVATHEAALQKHTDQPASADPKAVKQAEKTLRQLQKAVQQSREAVGELQAKLARVEADPQLSLLAQEHAGIASAVLQETAKLHAGDPENQRLWQMFLPPCLEDIDRIYRRLHVTFDHTLGESFYQDRLAGVVQDLIAKGLARESDGAIAVFLPNQPAPMLIRKKDGAFLYATTDLATIQYRVDQWHADTILYVVDHRQSLHFEQLFAAAKQWGYDQIEMQHVSFGTVLGDDGRPFKTRSGDTVGLSGLLDEGVQKAWNVVSMNDDLKSSGPELLPADRQRIAEVVGIAALKYADLCQNRASDYVFSYDKMLALTGNTATYMQYAYARVRSIFARGGIDIDAVVRSPDARISLDDPAERALGLEILKLPEALADTIADYRPNHLTNYLYELANRYAAFFERCPVLKAPNEATKISRLLLCELTARTLRLGLDLLGIQVVDKM